MDLFGNLALLAAFLIISYSLAKRKQIDLESKPNNEIINNNSKEIIEEINRRTKIIEKVDEFINTSKFIEPIATWRKDKIYKYIFNDGYLYEFDDIFPETKQKVGIDENYLCFKQFCYKRVNNPIDFFEKFGTSIN